MKLSSEDYCERRDEAEQLLLKARESIYPDLHGIGHSYGIGKFEDADKVYDVHQVIRYARGHWREPFSYYPVPKCTVGQWHINKSTQELKLLSAFLLKCP